ncbi:MAG TPA: head-tail connector protein [Acidimicrobiia bacterium]
MTTYATLDQVKAALRITDEIDDDLLTTALEAGSRWVDGWCDRSFTVAASGTAVYIPTGRMDDLLTDDLSSITSIAIDEDLDESFSTTLREIDYQPLPANATAGGRTVPFTRIRPIEEGYWPTSGGRATVRVIGQFGWPAIPAAVREATILQTSRLYTRLSSPAGVVSFGDMGAVRVSRFVDPDVELLLEPYRRVRL